MYLISTYMKFIDKNYKSYDFSVSKIANNKTLSLH